MVIGAFEKYVFGPRREAQKRADEAENRAAALEAWNERRLEAEARGESFDEPTPGHE